MYSFRKWMECRIEIDDIVPKELLVANYSRTIKFICNKCHQIYPIDALERHLTGVNRCPARPKVKIICPVESCKYHATKFFKRLKHLRAHYQHCHAPRQFDCTACGTFFRDEVALRSHQKTCGRISCDTCKKSFKVAEIDLFHSNSKIMTTQHRKMQESMKQPHLAITKRGWKRTSQDWLHTWEKWARILKKSQPKYIRCSWEQ